MIVVISKYVSLMSKCKSKIAILKGVYSKYPIFFTTNRISNFNRSNSGINIIESNLDVNSRRILVSETEFDESE